LALLRRSARNAWRVAFFFCSASPFRKPAFFCAHSASEGSCSPEKRHGERNSFPPWYIFRGTGDFAERAERSFRRSPAPASVSGPVRREGEPAVREVESPAFFAFASSSAAEFEAARICCSSARAAAAFSRG